ncbi:MAG: alpha/beta hydrolase [Leptolyngbyaceae cyanobacterium]
MRQFFTQVGLLLSSLGLALSGQVTVAAERVVINYGPLQDAIAVADLTDLAQSDKVSPTLAIYLNKANIRPEGVKTALTQSINVDLLTLDRILNSSLGEIVLDQLGEAIYTPTKNENRKALRSALILSTSNDGKVSLLEVLQNYPTQEVHLDAKRLLVAYQQVDGIYRRFDTAYRQFNKISPQLREIMGQIQQICPQCKLPVSLPAK